MNIEPLESRIAPASLTFFDVDGDKFTITTTGTGVLTFGVNVMVDNGQLQILDLRDTAFQGASVKIVAKPQLVLGADGLLHLVGDGFVNVGQINATGRDLGTVLVDGDLGALDAGDPTNPASACKGLTVQSLGRFGTSTGSPDLLSDFDGKLDTLTVKSDVKDAFVRVTDSGGAKGKIESVFVGGSLVGGTIISRDGIGTVTIRGDIVGGGESVSGAIVSSIKRVTVGGSVLGGSGAFSGIIFSEFGALGAVKIGVDLVGGSAAFSGRVFGMTMVESVTIGGSVVGTAFDESGQIRSDGALGSIKIGHNLIGGGGVNSGFIRGGTGIGDVRIGGSALNAEIRTGGDLGRVSIGGDFNGGGSSLGGYGGYISASGKLGDVNIGGSVLNKGFIRGTDGVGVVKIGGDVVANENHVGALVFTPGKITGISVGGSVAGTFSTSGSIQGVEGIGFVKIGGSISQSAQGGSEETQITGAKIGKVSIGGSLEVLIRADDGIGTVMIGGDVGGRGSIQTLLGKVGSISIRGSVGGGSGNYAGAISVASVDSVRIGGNVLGGSDANSGALRASAAGGIVIGGDVRGGSGDFSGSILADKLGSVKIGGSLIGGTAPTLSGTIFATGDIGSVKIGGNMRGASAVGDANIGPSGSVTSMFGRIGSVFVGGSIIVGTDTYVGDLTNNASIRAGVDIGSITVLGSLIGNTFNEEVRVIISALGKAGLSATATNDLAIGKITIGGHIERADILAGYDPALAPKNADAQIGTIAVGGDWAASKVLAGVGGGQDGVIGNLDDAKLGGLGVKDNADGIGAVSKIAAIRIKGSVLGTAAANDEATFAIVAQHIVSLKVGSAALRFTPGASNDLLEPISFFRILGSSRGATFDTFDFHVFEVA